MKRKRLIRIGIHNSLYLISFKTIAFSEGVLVTQKIRIEIEMIKEIPESLINQLAIFLKIEYNIKL